MTPFEVLADAFGANEPDPVYAGDLAKTAVASLKDAGYEIMESDDAKYFRAIMKASGLILAWSTVSDLFKVASDIVADDLLAERHPLFQRRRRPRRLSIVEPGKPVGS